MADQSFNGQATVLRRRKDESPFGFNFASRTLGTLRENIENVTKKVTIENIASSVSQVTRKKEEKTIVRRAPVGVTQSFSVVLTHILAPLWAVGTRPAGGGAANTELSADRIAELRESRNLKLRDTRYFDFARRLDQMGIEIERHADLLHSDERLATFYIVMLLARLMCIENGNGEYLWPPYLQLVDEVERRDKRSVSDLPDTHSNDEAAVHGQATRRLTEVGGQWRAPGAVDLPPQAHAARHKALTALFAASVCFKYTYNDDHVQCLVDSLCQQLKLLTYSETIVPLVAGVKGPQYVAKYIMFQCPAPSPPYVETDEVIPMAGGNIGNTAAAVASGILSGISGGLLGAGLLGGAGGAGGAGAGVTASINSSGVRSLLEAPDSGVASVSLQDVSAIALIALRNFVHRNDTSDLLMAAIGKALTISTDDDRTSLFVVAGQLLRQIYCVDVRMLAHLMDAARPFMLHRAPVGPAALKFIAGLSDLMRNAVSLPRQQLSSLFVAGREARSFRLQPAHLLTSPYCSRSASFVTSLNLGPIGMAFDPSAMYPIFGGPRGSLAASAGPSVSNMSGRGGYGASIGGNYNSNNSFGGAGAAAAQAGAGGEGPNGNGGNYVDDATLYVANQCINVFQALVELADGADPKIESMDLGRLFSIPPHVLCRYYPAVHNLLLSATAPIATTPSGGDGKADTQRSGSTDGALSASQTAASNPIRGGGRNAAAVVGPPRPGLTVPSRTPPALVEQLYDLYLTIMDQTRPERGQKRYRLESPREPFLPTFVNVCTDMDDMGATIMNVMERHWRYCDGRITADASSGGAAYLHPQRDLSLSHFIETDIRLVVAGGSGTFRHVVGAILQLQNTYPGALLRPKVYVLPLGYDNCVASWLALRDPIWGLRVHAPMVAEPTPTIDPPSVEAMLNVGGGGGGRGPSEQQQSADGSDSPPSPTRGGGGVGGAAAHNMSTVASVGGGGPNSKNGPPTSLKAFILRSALNDYLLHAKEENKVIVYQAECTAPDGQTTLVPFCCTLEVGCHVNNAVKADPVASSMLMRSGGGWSGTAFNSDASFVGSFGGPFGASSITSPSAAAAGGGGGVSSSAYTANSFVGSMAKSFMSGVNALTQSGVGGGGGVGNAALNDNTSMAGGRKGGDSKSGGGGGLDGKGGDGPDGRKKDDGPRLTNFINFGSTTKSERIDRILIGLHGHRGPRLATLKGFTGLDHPHAAVGRDLLDWVSTTYHVFSAEEAAASAQAMVDAGLLVPCSWGPNSDPYKFSEKNLYTLCRREANDAQPLAAPCSRGLVMDTARMLLGRYVDQVAVKEGFRGGGGSGGFGGDGPTSPSGGGKGGAAAATANEGMESGSSPMIGANPNASMVFGGAGNASMFGASMVSPGSPQGGGTFGSPAAGAGGGGGGGGSAGVPTMRCRVSFAGRKGDLRYIDIDEGLAIDAAAGIQNVSTSLVEAHGPPKPSAAAASASNANCPTSVSSAAAAALLRDIVSIKLRSTGAPGDKGPATNPTAPTLHMSIRQPDRKRLSAGGGASFSGSNTNNGRHGGDLAELFDHYQLNFGDKRPTTNSNANSDGSSSPWAGGAGGAAAAAAAASSAVMVDINTVLTIEHTRPAEGGGASPRGGRKGGVESANQNDAGLILSADGDLFGPFTVIRVRPVTINLARGGGGGAAGANSLGAGGAFGVASPPVVAAAGDAAAYKPAATVSVMSYMQLPCAQEAAL